VVDVVDAVVVGAGPNGLTAAVTLARAGRSVTVLEAADTVGGGCRSAALTLPGFVHDTGAAIHALGVASPALTELPLERHGLTWVHPEVPLAHPLDRGRAAVLHRSLDRTVDRLGADGRAWRRLFGPLVADWDRILPGVLGSLLRPPRHPLAMARLGPRAAPPASLLARRFTGEEAAALFGGCAAHGFLPLEHLLTAAFGTLLVVNAHASGWPVARGGSQAVSDALAAHLIELGGTIETGHRVERWADLPPHRAVLFDTDPAQVASIAGDRLPAGFRRRLRRFRHGPAAFKVDYALDGPAPWTNERCRRAGTVHVGGRFAELAAAERDVWRGRMPERPFVLVAQQSLADPSRAPAGKHTLWAYAHVPTGYRGDATDAIEAQLERFAPGFRDVVLARHVTTPADFAAANPNFVGGDIAGGAHDGLQLVARPTIRTHRTPDPSLFVCSASTPPGGGVHGACGANAARAALAGPLR
jgi:phytoene dehydrogenase-like protein